MPTVRTGIQSFIDTFAGTPVKLQVVTFSSQSDTLGAGSGWTQVLRHADRSGRHRSEEPGRGPHCRRRHQLGGRVLPDAEELRRHGAGPAAQQHPVTSPTASRRSTGSTTHRRPRRRWATPPTPASLRPTATDFSQLAWNRTERLIRDRGAINLIGVYVNSNVDATSTWATRVGYHIDYNPGEQPAVPERLHRVPALEQPAVPDQHRQRPQVPAVDRLELAVDRPWQLPRLQQRPGLRRRVARVRPTARSALTTPDGRTSPRTSTTPPTRRRTATTASGRRSAAGRRPPGWP